ncbi:MAG: radical SAM protein [Archaeoglobi archaeon]|nr:radical SAM protein [Archaeoglobi archaeon]
MIAILDGYVDEPSCLGVPPYISPYPRYIAGMLEDLRVPWFYVTADEYRKNPAILEKAKKIIVIAGIAVPGKYLGGRPLGLAELPGIAPDKEKILVGPITLELEKELDGYEVLRFPFEHELYEVLGGRSEDRSRNFVNRFAVLGAKVVRQHPDFPHVICEIETYKGCYWGRCSFCIERIHRISMRDPKAVIAEIKALYDQGVRHFRLGNQTDFFTYMADFDREFPRPNPEFMRNFHRAIWRECPKIKTLHLDNVNPKTIAEYPEESREIIKTIVTYQTPGNVAAMGIESADERVIRENSLLATPEEVMFAIEEINRYGRYAGHNGLPYFLPGVNFVFGLKGETKRTFEENYSFLMELLDRGLMVRRVNLRQVKVFPFTPMARVGDRNVRRHKRYFRLFKEKIRRDFDRKMLERIVPRGRLLRDLRVETREGRVSFSRQLATYPLLVGMYGEFERNEIVEARVVDYGRRSITAVPRVSINEVKMYQLLAIPGIGKATASEILAKRPFKSLKELEEVVGAEKARILSMYLEIG